MFPTTSVKTAVSSAKPAIAAASAARPPKLTPKSVAVVATAAYYSGHEPDKLSGKFGGLFLVDPNGDQATALQTLKQQIEGMLVQEFGSVAVPDGVTLPFRSGDEVRPDGRLAFVNDAFRGKLVITARSNQPIATFFGPARTACEPNKIEGGDLVVVELRPFLYSQGGNTGISCALNAAWLLEKGAVKLIRGGGAGSTFSQVDLGNFAFATTNTNYQ